jgi:TolB-like protein
MSGVGFSALRRLSLLAGFGLVVLGGQALAAGTASRRLAVLEFQGKIEDDVLNAFADAVRGGAVEGLAACNVKVITHENMMVLLRDMGKSDCTEGDCEVETARNIGADFVVSGSVVNFDNTYVITLKLHETKEGGLLATDNEPAARAWPRSGSQEHPPSANQERRDAPAS